MFGRMNRFCNPYKRWLGLALLALGILMLLIFVPIQIWLAILGVAFIIIGCILLR